MNDTNINAHLSAEQIETVRTVISSIFSADAKGLSALKDVSLYNDTFELEQLKAYGIKFGGLPTNFEQYIELVKFKNRPGYAFEVRLWDECGNVTDVIVNFELHDEFDPPQIYVGWPSLI